MLNIWLVIAVGREENFGIDRCSEYIDHNASTPAHPTLSMWKLLLTLDVKESTHNYNTTAVLPLEPPPHCQQSTRMGKQVRSEPLVDPASRAISKQVVLT